MALNLSGPISLNGSTSGQSIGLELGKSSTASISLNDTDVRTLAGILSGAISLGAFYGKSAASESLGTTWTTNRFDVNLNAIAPTNSGFIAVGDLGRILTSTDGNTWTTIVSGTNNNLRGVWYSTTSGLAVAVGDAGTILTSSDLNTWTAQTSGVTHALRDVVHNGSTWVVVGDTATVLTSSNGSSWTSQTSGQPYGINSVAWSPEKSLFVACGNNRYIISSPDGVSWTTRLTGTSGAFNAVRWGSNTIQLFVVVGAGGNLLTSPDGTTWTVRTSGTSTETFYGIVRGPTYWVCVGSGGIRFSTNATSWSFHTNPGVTLTAIAFNAGLGLHTVVGNSYYIAASTSGNSSYNQRQRTFDIDDMAYSPSLGRYVICGSQGRVENSTDAINWSVGTSSVATGNSIYSIVWNGSIFAAVTTTGTAPVITSTTGLTFTSRTTPAAQQLRSIIWDNNNSRFLAGGTFGYLTKSSDGTTWSDLTSISGVMSVVYAPSLSRYVAVGRSGFIYTSANGQQWGRVVTTVGNALNAVTWNGSLFVAVGSRTIRTSPDGITWTTQSSGTSAVFYDVVWTGSQFYVVGSSGAIRSSFNGTTWTTETSGTTSAFNSVAFGAGLVVACGSSGAVRTSSPGSGTWTSRTFGTTTTINKVIFDGTRFVALASNTSRYSLNGTTWTGGGSPNMSPGTATSIATNGSVIAIGANNGLIRTSTNGGLNWSVQTTQTSESLGGMCWDGSKFVLMAQTSNQIIHSNYDATSWPIIVSGTTVAGIARASTISRSVIVGNNGTILTISDSAVSLGQLPEIRNIDSTYALLDVAWSGPTFVAVGTTGKILASTDGGISWQSRTSGVTSALSGVKWVGIDMIFVVSGPGGLILTSQDTITWTVRTSNTTYNLNNIQYLNDRLFAVGQSGIILQSGP